MTASLPYRSGKDDVALEAAEYLVRLLDRPDDENLRSEFDAWLSAEPAHAVAFAQAESAWEATERLKARGLSINDIVKAAPTPKFASLFQPSRRKLLITGAAAASLIAVTSKLFAGADYSTDVGEVRNIRLADGSILRINTNSRVNVNYQSQRRSLQLLQGEASFKVAHDEQKPFDVQVGHATVRALGTEFNIRLRRDLIELTVIEGSVGVHTANKMRKVAAGEGAVIQPGVVALCRLNTRALDQRTAWREGIIELDGDSIAQAVDEFNRYRSMPIVIADQKLAPLRIGGRFSVHDSEQFLTALEQTLPIRAVEAPDGSILLLPRDEVV